MDTVSDQAAVQESQKSSLQISFYIFRALAFADRNRSIASLVGVILLVTLCDILFDAVLFEPYKGVIAFFSGSFPEGFEGVDICLLYTSPSPRDYAASRMPSSA